jgi:hypothetical protein
VSVWRSCCSSVATSGISSSGTEALPFLGFSIVTTGEKASPAKALLLHVSSGHVGVFGRSSQFDRILQPSEARATFLVIYPSISGLRSASTRNKTFGSHLLTALDRCSSSTHVPLTGQAGTAALRSSSALLLPETGVRHGERFGLLNADSILSISFNLQPRRLWIAFAAWCPGNRLRSSFLRRSKLLSLLDVVELHAAITRPSQNL